MHKRIYEKPDDSNTNPETYLLVTFFENLPTANKERIEYIDV